MPVSPEVASTITAPARTSSRGLGRLDHGEAHAVMAGAAGVVQLGLGEHAARGGWAGVGLEAAQLEERRVADEIEDAVDDARVGWRWVRLYAHGSPRLTGAVMCWHPGGVKTHPPASPGSSQKRACTLAPPPKKSGAEEGAQRGRAGARIGLEEGGVVVAGVLHPDDRREDARDVPLEADARLEDGHGALVDREDAELPCWPHTTTVRSIGALDASTELDWNVAGNWMPPPMPGVSRGPSK